MPGDGMASYLSRRSQRPAWRRAIRPKGITIPPRLRYRDDEFELESEDSGDESLDDLIPSPLAVAVGNVPTPNLNIQAEDDTDSEPDTPITPTPAPVAPAAPVLTPPPIITLTPIAPPRQTRSTTTSIAAVPTTVTVEAAPVTVVSTARVITTMTAIEPVSLFQVMAVIYCVTNSLAAFAG